MFGDSGTLACECFKFVKNPIFPDTKITYIETKSCKNCKKLSLVLITFDKNKKGERIWKRLPKK